MASSDSYYRRKWKAHLSSAAMFAVFEIIEVSGSGKTTFVFILYVIYSLIFAIYYLHKDLSGADEGNSTTSLHRLELKDSLINAVSITVFAIATYVLTKVLAVTLLFLAFAVFSLIMAAYHWYKDRKDRQEALQEHSDLSEEENQNEAKH